MTFNACFVYRACDDIRYQVYRFILTASTPAVSEKRMAVRLTAKIIKAFCMYEVSKAEKTQNVKIVVKISLSTAYILSDALT